MVIIFLFRHQKVDAHEVPCLLPGHQHEAVGFPETNILQGNMKVNPDPQFDKTEFVICAGDIAPIDLRYKEYNEVLQGVPFLPVIGNHEFVF